MLAPWRCWDRALHSSVYTGPEQLTHPLHPPKALLLNKLNVRLNIHNVSNTSVFHRLCMLQHTSKIQPTVGVEARRIEAGRPALPLEFTLRHDG